MSCLQRRTSRCILNKLNSLLPCKIHNYILKSALINKFDTSKTKSNKWFLLVRFCNWDVVCISFIVGAACPAHLILLLLSALKLLRQGKETRIALEGDFPDFFHFILLKMSRSSEVDIVACCGLDGPGSNPGVDEILRTCPDRSWGSPSLRCSGYRAFPGVKWPGRDINHVSSSRSEVNERVEPYLYPPMCLHDRL